MEFVLLLQGGKIYEKSGNQDIAIALSQWVFKEHGQLRVKSVNHHKAGETKPPSDYTIMDDAVSYLYFTLI